MSGIYPVRTPDSLDIVPTAAGLPKLPLFQITIYQAEKLTAAATAFGDVVRRSVAVG